MILLASNLSEITIKAAQFILSFSILILLHEFGHYITAKWFGCRVEKFYLFFNPWFSLFKKKVGETEYGIGWIPLGGYVKISGMIDESMDKEAMKKPPEPHEFRSKPAWQRLIIMLGGVIVNVILAILIFIVVLWVWGKEYLPPANAKYGIATDSLAKSVGLKDGDIVWKVDTTTVKDLLLVRSLIILEEAKTLTVQRGDSTFQLGLDEGLVKKLNTRSAGSFVAPRFPFIIKEIPANSNAQKGGLQAGDQIIAVNDSAATFYHEVARHFSRNKDKAINLKILRGNDTMTKTVQVDKKGIIGARIKLNEELGFMYHHEKFSFFESIPAGFKECFETLSKYVIGLRQLFTGKANPNESLGSVFSIGSIYSPTWHWQSFWTYTAIFSIILAFMNILPIPALDGGHALFTFYEMVTGHKPSDKFMEIAQMVGMVLLLGLMAYALGLDISRWFK